MRRLDSVGLLIKSYCERFPHPEYPDRSLARMIVAENPHLYPNHHDIIKVERVRHRIRYFRDHAGDFHRKYSAHKHLTAELTYKYDANNTYLQNKDSKQYLEAKAKKLSKSKYYIITCAQNNTAINLPFLRNIEAYAKFLGAEIHVILSRYKNPTSTFNSAEDKWDPSILKYADANRHNLHPSLELFSDIKIQPTAATPLTGLEGLSGTKSCIFGHPKVHFKVIPALEGYEPKMMFTTGAVTKPNYTDSKAGKKGEFHHTYGFVIVEVKDKNTFFIRQVTANASGDFTDLIYSVSAEAVSKINKIAYFNVGDKHIGVHCPQTEKSQEGLLNYFKPQNTIVHDVFNGTSVNHHIEKDPIKKYALQLNGDNLIKKEFDNLYKWAAKWLKYNLVVISSNHNDWVDRYIKSMDWKKDIPNAAEYMRLAQLLLSGAAKHGIVAYMLKERFGNKIRTIGRNESFRIKGIELSQHGDVGMNGARGSMLGFKKLSTKIDVMHTHAPAREDGVMYGGTSTILRQDYMVGASNHKNADIICHLDGKRQHIIYMGKSKEFTTFKLK